MSLYRPRKPNQPGARLSVWEMLFGGKFPFKSDSNGKWSYGPSGYRYKPNFPSSSGGAGASKFWMYPTHKEGDPTLPYDADTFMYLSPLNPLVTTGLRDLISGTVLLAQPGFWQAAQNVPAAVLVAGVLSYNVPQIAAQGAVTGSPAKGDLDNNLFWIRHPQTNGCI